MKCDSKLCNNMHCLWVYEYLFLSQKKKYTMQRAAGCQAKGY